VDVCMYVCLFVCLFVEEYEIGNRTETEGVRKRGATPLEGPNHPNRCRAR
jgi:hypothetical protein